jgi:hypothetical protein
MKNPGDQNVLAFLTIVDDVGLDCEGSHAWTELRTCTAHPRLFGQQIEAVEDLVEVLLGETGEPIRHLRLLGASCATARLDPLGELPA